MKKSFDYATVLTVSLAHLVGDMYSSFLAPVLPLLITQLGISNFQGGMLDFARKIPSLLNPVFGIIADKIDAKYFMIIGIIIITVSMSLLGVVPDFITLFILVFTAGLGTSIFHVPGPVIIKKVAHERLGLGMSFYMLGGEFARTLGPLLILGAVSLWEFEGTYRVMPLGLAVAAILYFRFRKIHVHKKINKKDRGKADYRKYLRFFVIITGIVIFRSGMHSALTLYLPTYLTHKGNSLWLAGISLSILQFAGAAGTFSIGMLSDKLGRRKTLENLIKIDSQNPFTIDKNESGYILGGNENTIAEYIIEELKKSGFKTQTQYVHSDSKEEKFYNILVEKGIGDKSILFYAHMDTVTSNPWLSTEDALAPKYSKLIFQGKEREVLVGLGSNDMKTGIAVILEAFKNIEPEYHKIKLCFGVDEEFFSLGSNALVRSDFMNDVKAVVVPEIGDGPNNVYGAGSIGIGRLGRCEFIIDIFGTGGHGAISFDESFINAAVEGSKIVTALEGLRKTYKDRFEFFISEVPDEKAINYIEGSFFVNKINCGDGSLSIPSKGKISIDCTFTPNMTIEKLQRMFDDMINSLYENNVLREVVIDGVVKRCSVKLKERPTPFSEGYLTGESHPFTVYVKEQIEKTIPFMNYNMGYSVADENVFKRYFPEIPVLVLGPVGWNSHRANEWVEIKSVYELEKVYKDIGKDFNKYLEKINEY